MTLTVHTDSSNPQLWRILVAAAYAGVKVESKLGVDASSKEFESKSPLGKVPVLETPEGNLFEANAITRYVARLGKGNLYGATVFEAGQIEQFVDFAANEIELPGSVWVFPILGLIPSNSLATQKAKGDIRKSLDYLNKHLLSRTFLVGERITVADIVVATSLYYLYQRVLDGAFRKQFINTNRWYTTVVNQPEFKTVIGEVKLCEKMEVAVETAAPVKVEKVAEPKKAAEPKKEQPKKEKPKDDEEEENEFEEKETKKPNPLDFLPPSKMVMDEWKRTYSNSKDIRGQANKWFWEKYDKEGYCLYLSEYNYNEECEKSFMTCNLVTGYMQRLDKVRKHGFGSLLIFGDEPKLEIACVWLFRGTEIPEEMKAVDDYEQYTWTKLDSEDATHRAIVEDFWAWDGKFGKEGRVLNQGKTFK